MKRRMNKEPYKLPDGRIVMIDSSASKSAPVINYELANGTLVMATLVR